MYLDFQNDHVVFLYLCTGRCLRCICFFLLKYHPPRLPSTHEPHPPHSPPTNAVKLLTTEKSLLQEHSYMTSTPNVTSLVIWPVHRTYNPDPAPNPAFAWEICGLVTSLTLILSFTLNGQHYAVSDKIHFICTAVHPQPLLEKQTVFSFDLLPTG